jgi:hypothetical protein
VDSLSAFRDHLHVRPALPVFLALAVLVVVAPTACLAPDHDTADGGAGSPDGGAGSPDALRFPDAPDLGGPDALHIPGDSGIPTYTPDAAPTFAVKLTFKGSGGGKVTVTPASGAPTDCSSDCTLPYPPGTSVTLSAAASDGSTFVSWGGACTGQSPCPLTLDVDRAVDVTFNAQGNQVTLMVGTTGPGAVMVTPAGTACGPGCSRYPTSTPVMLTAKANLGYSFTGWTLGPCAAKAASCPLTLTGNVAVNADFCAYQKVVDPSGSNTGAGTCADPYRNVTKALSVAVAGDVVAVHRATYDAAAGESFPLVIPAGVTVVGDETSKGLGDTPIELKGNAASVVTLGAGATLAGVVVTGVTNPAACVTVSGAGATVRNATVDMCALGVKLSAATALASGVVATMNGTGLEIADGASGARVEGCVLANNATGLHAAVSADAGGGSAGSAGGNVLSCNTTTDLSAAAGVTVSAKSNVWDHQSPSAGCSGGADICASGATVVTDGATLAALPCP